jgi:hypothetical protein
MALKPDGIMLESESSAFSGFWLSINFSTGRDVGAGGGVTPAALVSGVCIGMVEFGGRNFDG